MFVVDTNVVSEIVRPQPDDGVLAWFKSTPRHIILLPSVVIAELYLGVALMPEGKRRDAFAAFIDGFIRDGGGEETILVFGFADARHYAAIISRRTQIGRPIKVLDAQIAATAAARRLPVVTRNVRDFEHCGIEVINPWEAGTR